MAANKFATFLLTNTNRFTVVLTYALLEWILILLLLFNSLITHLIVKFAEVFGLRPPCPWCANLDRVLDPEKGSRNTIVDLLCEFHANEVSELGYCSNHRRLAESRDMCEDCFTSSPEFQGVLGETGVGDLKCSCCGVSLDDDLFSSYMLLKTLSWNVIEGYKKEKMIAMDNLDEMEEGEAEGKEVENADFIMKDESVQACEVIGNFSQHLDSFVDCSGRKLVPVELPDSVAEEEECRSKCDFKVDDHESILRGPGFSEGCEVQVEEDQDLVFDDDLNELPKSTMLESMEMEEAEESLVIHSKDSLLDNHTVCEEVAPMENNENEANVSIQMDIPDLNVANETENQGSNECTHLGALQVFGTEESLYEDVTDIKQLKSELRARQESLQVLYTELEEERNSSEVAANETMAMINRLQEEKAAIQMEALQYHRLMEEQSEFDQEALQLLNNLLVKREKENKELAKELEVCKMKILDYETKENNGGVMTSFEGCLAEFEDERLSILGQLQFLEGNSVVKEMNGKSPFDANGVHDCHVLKENELIRHLYERLEALESDIFFFKNCVGSLQKGGKGIDLLQEILQNLRHLRNSELSQAH